MFADWVFGLFRTDPESERHRGLSKILVPLSADGITVRPIAQLNGLPGFAEIFFDDVRVPAFNLLGGDGEGWNIAMATAGFERGLMLRSPARFQQAAKRLEHIASRHRFSFATSRDEVLLEMERKLARDEDNVTLLMEFAERAKKVGDLLRAVVALKRLVRIRPDDAWVYDTLVYFCGTDTEAHYGTGVSRP